MDDDKNQTAGFSLSGEKTSDGEKAAAQEGEEKTTAPEAVEEQAVKKPVRQAGAKKAAKPKKGGPSARHAKTASHGEASGARVAEELTNLAGRKLTTQKGGRKTAASPRRHEALRPKPAAKYPDTSKVRALSKENPAREGTNSHRYYTLIQKAKTIGDYRTAGGNLKYLYWFVDRGLASIG
jgi:hypothetical protein